MEPQSGFLTDVTLLLLFFAGFTVLLLIGSAIHEASEWLSRKRHERNRPDR